MTRSLGFGLMLPEQEISHTSISLSLLNGLSLPWTPASAVWADL